jgi:phospholipase/carboxylesterase
MMPETLAAANEAIYHGHLDAAEKRPFSVFLPRGYEPRYAYPLLVLLHGRGEHESQWLAALPELSRRNYLAVALRGPETVLARRGRIGFGWSGEDVDDYVLAAIDEVRSRWNVHSRRILAVGVEEGASLALRLGLQLPMAFGGAVALNGWLPDGPLGLTAAGQRLRGISGPSFFIGHSAAHANVPAARSEKAASLLYSAGFDVEGKLYSTSAPLCRSMLRDVDRWLVGLCTR